MEDIFERQKREIAQSIELGGICIGIARMLEKACNELPDGKDKLIEIANGLLEELREKYDEERR